MTAPDTQPQGDTRTLAEQIRACADAVTTAARLDRSHVVAATLRDLADRAAETEQERDRQWQLKETAQGEIASARLRAEHIKRYTDALQYHTAQLLRLLGTGSAQGGTESNAAGRAAALTGTSPREGAAGAQEPAARCGKYSRPGLGGILGPCTKPPGHGDEWHFDPSGAAWDPASDPQPARPICPGCELPETNCACG